MGFKRQIIASVIVFALACAALGYGTIAYLSDIETSEGNTFTAGTLDLKVDGGDVNVVKWTVVNMVPGSQPLRTFTLKNEGSIKGYLDIENIVVTEHENGRIDPEIDAGDVSDGVGELGSVVKINLFVDLDGDGWYDAGDSYIQTNIFMKDLPTHYELDHPMAAGEIVYITAQVNWWSTAMDNQAQGDSLDLDLEFELAQTTAQ